MVRRAERVDGCLILNVCGRAGLGFESISVVERLDELRAILVSLRGALGFGAWVRFYNVSFADSVVFVASVKFKLECLALIGLRSLISYQRGEPVYVANVQPCPDLPAFQLAQMHMVITSQYECYDYPST